MLSLKYYWDTHTDVSQGVKHEGLEHKGRGWKHICVSFIEVDAVTREWDEKIEKKTSEDQTIRAFDCSKGTKTGRKRNSYATGRTSCVS